MDQPAEPLDHNLDSQRQRSCDNQLAHSVRAMLPPPDQDTPEAWFERDLVAIGKAGLMSPDNAEEADLAARVTACYAHADHCLRRAAENLGDVMLSTRLYAQAASMGREARGNRSLLLRVQAARRKRAANDNTRNSDAVTEQGFLGRMHQALEHLPPGAPARASPPTVLPRTVPRAAPSPAAAEPPSGAPAEPPPPPAAFAGATPIRYGPLIDYDDWTDEEKARERLVADAGRFAIHHPMRVQQIRKLGGLPPDCDYEPPPPAVLHEIIHGNGSNLRWADTYVPWKPPPDS